MEGKRGIKGGHVDTRIGEGEEGGMKVIVTLNRGEVNCTSETTYPPGEGEKEGLKVIVTLRIVRESER